MSKNCRKCRIDKDASEFNRKGDRAQPYCRDCQSLTAKARYRANAVRERSRLRDSNKKLRAKYRQLVLDAKTKPCADCGRTFDPVCMDFDHIRGKKVCNVSTMAGDTRSLASILEEIEKCEVVCACCHRLRTKQRKKILGESFNRQDSGL